MNAIVATQPLRKTWHPIHQSRIWSAMVRERRLNPSHPYPKNTSICLAFD